MHVEKYLIGGLRYLAICRCCPMRTMRLVMQLLAAAARNLDPSVIASKHAQFAVATQTLMLDCYSSDVAVSERDLAVKFVQALLPATTTLLTL